MAPGGVVVYTITFDNTGTTDEHHVVVNDSLIGPGIILSTALSHGACNPPTLPAKTAVHCSLGTLGPGSSATITIEKLATKFVGGTGEFIDPSELRSTDSPSSSSPA